MSIIREAINQRKRMRWVSQQVIHMTLWVMLKQQRTGTELLQRMNMDRMELRQQV